ncbi:glycosyltransferase family 4 protein [Peribacillus butanolivorans]|uniref:glycosyltransferase family 4 protein n=1 Tax=Peribacillus butanolivorans TaxID=421767 RepID=UPI00368D651B
MSRSEEKLKILLITPLPPPAGGIATWTKLFINSDQAKKNVVDVINTSIRGKRIYNIGKKSIIDEIKRAASIYLTTRKQLNKGYDIVHINSSCSKFGMIRDYICIKKAKNTKTKIVVHLHCDTSYMVKGKFSEFIFRKICNIADKIFCLNESSNKHIKLISNKKSIMIPNFIDMEKMNPYQNNVSDNMKNIIYVGHVIKSKGCIDIISVAKKMPDLNFKLIGKVSEEIKNIPTPENIQCFGEISKEEVLKQMQSGDLLLFPTYTEGFPNVVLESMACGLPIISTPVGAIPEMIEELGGIIIDVGNIDGFVKAIEGLQDKEIRKQMSIWNKEKVKKTYTLDLVSNQIFKEYSNI